MMRAGVAAVAGLWASIALPSIARGDRDRLYVRAGILHIAPMSKSRELVLSDVHGPASLSLMDGPVAGSGTVVDPITSPAAVIGYRLPVLRDRLAIETVLAPPIQLRFRATGTLADESIADEALGVPTGVPALGSELGEAKAAPPVVTLVYALLGGDAVVPYAGVGGTVLFAYDAHVTNPVLTEAAEPRLAIDPAPGLVLQAGLDARIWRRVRARVDVKYIAFMTTHATVDDLRVRTPDLPLFESVDVGTATMVLTVNPVIVHAGIGVDFL
jgi:outer membrane protein W